MRNVAGCPIFAAASRRIARELTGAFGQFAQWNEDRAANVPGRTAERGSEPPEGAPRARADRSPRYPQSYISRWPKPARRFISISFSGWRKSFM